MRGSPIFFTFFSFLSLLACISYNRCNYITLTFCSEHEAIVTRYFREEWKNMGIMRTFVMKCAH